jgi:uncharacterized membrane protein
VLLHNRRIAVDQGCFISATGKIRFDVRHWRNDDGKRAAQKIWALFLKLKEENKMQLHMKNMFMGSIGGASQALVAIVIGLAGVSAAQAQGLYSVTDLGPAPSGYSCWPTKLNDRGDVAAACAALVANTTTTNVLNEAGVWRNGTASLLGLLNGEETYATSINNLGAVTGTGGNIPQGWVTTATPGVLLNFFPNSGNTRTVFIGDTGWIGGYYIKGTAWKAAIWTPDSKGRYRVTDLPFLPGGINSKFTFAIANAFNQSGQGAGYAQTDQIGQHAVFWNNDAAHSIVDLGVVPGDWASWAYGMNDLGQVVGVGNSPVVGLHPVVWNNDAARTPVALPLLPGDTSGSAYGISNAGHVIGISMYLAPGTREAPNTPRRSVVWRDGGVFELTSLLDAGWTDISAAAINSLGQIAAYGTFNGAPRNVILTPLQ